MDIRETYTLADLQSDMLLLESEIATLDHLQRQVMTPSGWDALVSARLALTCTRQSIENQMREILKGALT